jgi:hypothetical protein
MRILTLAWDSPGGGVGAPSPTADLLQVLAGRGAEVSLVFSSQGGPLVLTGLRVLPQGWAATHPTETQGTPPALHGGGGTSGPASLLYPAGGPPLIAEMACVA